MGVLGVEGFGFWQPEPFRGRFGVLLLFLALSLRTHRLMSFALVFSVTRSLSLSLSLPLFFPSLALWWSAYLSLPFCIMCMKFAA